MQLNAAQLLMGVMEKEQGKLRRRIKAKEFSTELQSQTASLQEARPVIEEGEKSKGSHPATVGSSSLFAPQPTTSGNLLKGQTAQSHKSSPAKGPSKASKEKAKEDLVITNPAILDKIMAKLEMPAEARQACKNAEDSAGRLSCKSMAAILNQPGPPEQSTSKPATVPAEDVQKLLDSMRQTRDSSQTKLSGINAKPAGSYTLSEFRELMGSVAEQAAEQAAGTKLTQEVVTKQKIQASSDSGSSAVDAGAPAPQPSVDQIERLSLSRVPGTLLQGSEQANEAYRKSGSLKPGEPSASTPANPQPPAKGREALAATEPSEIKEAVPFRPGAATVPSQDPSRRPAVPSEGPALTPAAFQDGQPEAKPVTIIEAKIAVEHTPLPGQDGFASGQHPGVPRDPSGPATGLAGAMAAASEGDAVVRGPEVDGMKSQGPAGPIRSIFGDVQRVSGVVEARTAQDASTQNGTGERDPAPVLDRAVQSRAQALARPASTDFAAASSIRPSSASIGGKAVQAPAMTQEGSPKQAEKEFSFGPRAAAQPSDGAERLPTRPQGESLLTTAPVRESQGEAIGGKAVQAPAMTEEGSQEQVLQAAGDPDLSLDDTDASAPRPSVDQIERLAASRIPTTLLPGTEQVKEAYKKTAFLKPGEVSTSSPAGSPLSTNDREAPAAAGPRQAEKEISFGPGAAAQPSDGADRRPTKSQGESLLTTAPSRESQGEAKPVTVMEPQISAKGTPYPTGDVVAAAQRPEITRDPSGAATSLAGSMAAASEGDAVVKGPETNGMRSQGTSESARAVSGDTEKVRGATESQTSRDTSMQNGTERRDPASVLDRTVQTGAQPQSGPAAGDLAAASSVQPSSSSFSREVGQAPADGHLSLNQPGWTQDLSDRLQEMHRQTHSEITLDLEPQDLGRISVRVEAHSNHVSAYISTGSENAKSLLLGNSSLLRQHLEAQGLTLGQFLVDVRQGNDTHQRSQRQGTGGGRAARAQKVRETGEVSSRAARSVYATGTGQQTISLFA